MEGVAPQMPTPAAAEAVKAGCARLQHRCQERILQSFGSCREFFSVLSSNGRKELLQADSIQQSSAELEAIRSSVQDLYKDLHEHRKALAAANREEVAVLASCPPAEQDQDENDAVVELIEDTKQLAQLLKALQELKPQLETQAHPGSMAREDESGRAQWDAAVDGNV